MTNIGRSEADLAADILKVMEGAFVFGSPRLITYKMVLKGVGTEVMVIGVLAGQGSTPDLVHSTPLAVLMTPEFADQLVFMPDEDKAHTVIPERERKDDAADER